MVRQGPVVSRAALVFLAMAGLAHGQAAREKRAAPAPNEGIDRLPYKIAVQIAIDPGARIDARGRELLLDSWQTLVHRLVGAPWDLNYLDEGFGVPGLDLETLEPGSLREVSGQSDKVWVIQISRDGAALRLAGRELDTATGRLGPTYHRPARFSGTSPSTCFALRARSASNPEGVSRSTSAGRRSGRPARWGRW
jgi:hypothetical protein